MSPWPPVLIGGGIGVAGGIIGAWVGARLSGSTEHNIERERQRYGWEKDIADRVSRLESRLAGIEGLLRFFHPELRQEKFPGKD